MTWQVLAVGAIAAKVFIKDHCHGTAPVHAQSPFCQHACIATSCQHAHHEMPTTSCQHANASISCQRRNGGTLMRTRLANNFLPTRPSNNRLLKPLNGQGLHPRNSTFVQTKMHDDCMMGVLRTAGSMMYGKRVRPYTPIERRLPPQSSFRHAECW